MKETRKKGRMEGRRDVGKEGRKVKGGEGKEGRKFERKTKISM